MCDRFCMVQKRKFVENQPEVGFYIKRSVLVNNTLVEVFGIRGAGISVNISEAFFNFVLLVIPNANILLLNT